MQAITLLESLTDNWSREGPAVPKCKPLHCYKASPIKLESSRTDCPKMQAITLLQSLTDKTEVEEIRLSQNASHCTSVADPWHFGVDPDPRIHASDYWIRIQIRMQIRILLFLSLTFKMPAKKVEGSFTSFYKGKKSKKSHKTVEIKVFFLLSLLNDRSIRSRIRIHTSDLWIRIRIQEAQKHVDPVDPDPQHCIVHCYKASPIKLESRTTCCPRSSPNSRAWLTVSTSSGLKHPKHGLHRHSSVKEC